MPRTHNPIAKGTKRDAARAPRATIYAGVTARIIAELEAGRLPWVQPWGTSAAIGPALPRNALTARPYSGINILILWGAVIAHGYPSQCWLTFAQALAAGGRVRKGERGQCVVYADRFVPEAEKARAAQAGEDAMAVPFLKRFTLFNAAQCDGLPAHVMRDPAPLPEREIIPVAEEVIAASGIELRIGGDCACYVPGADYVQVPPQPAFFDQVNYYRTCLHELTHATGHPKRLARDLSHPFGSPGYAREELVAELGSAFLCAALGITPTVPCRLYRRVARGAARRRPGDLPRGEPRQQSRRLAARALRASKGREDRGMIALPSECRAALRANALAARDPAHPELPDLFRAG